MCINDISMDRRMIHFISKDLAGDMKEERVSFDEYCNRFLSIENQRDIMRFDVYSYINDTDIHQKHTPRNKIGYMDEISCLLGQHNLVVDSMQILCEWYQLLLETLNQRQNVSLDENKYLVNAGDMELFLNMPKRNSRNYLHNLIRRFNYLIQRIEQLSEGEEHD